ncbi:MAG: zinc ABC transporter ATP-binding protein ZnuC [Gammaproteobacteria bacterium]|nr:zinc ABC transporter ATP-binding protein ZnuC [Gammaproteobacteria bacterium]
MNAKPLVNARGIGLQIGEQVILRDISLQLETGKIVSLIGPNGAGKTTLVRVILGLIQPDQGTIERQANIVVSYLPQKLALQPVMPITVKRFMELNIRSNDKSIEAALHEAGVARLTHAALQSISGGELQRVMLARCLLRNPQLLVLDEPDQGMDPTGLQVLYELITDIRDRYQCGILMVSHDLHLVMASTDQVVCLNQHVCCTGHPESISEHPEFLQLFGKPVSGLAVYTHHHDHKHNLHGDVVND